MGEIEAKIEINERRHHKTNPLKIKFESQMEFLDKKETKRNKQKNFHLYIFEEILVVGGLPGAGQGKNNIQYTYRPLLDCQDLAVFNEAE